MSRFNALMERAKQSPDYKRKAARALVTADLRILIANADKTHKDVAEAIGISQAALSAKLSGDKNLTLDSIVDIAAAVGAEVDLVFRPAGSKRALQTWEAAAKAEHVRNRIADILRKNLDFLAIYARPASPVSRISAVQAACANDSGFKKYADSAHHRSIKSINIPWQATADAA